MSDYLYTGPYNCPNLRVVIVNGKPCVGKSTFERLCAGIVGGAYCKQRSSIDRIKEIAKFAECYAFKMPKGRKLLSDLKKIFTEYNDLPTIDIFKTLNEWLGELRYYHVDNNPHVLFVDDREPAHIIHLKEELEKANVKVVTLLIRRPVYDEAATSNSSDENVFNYKYDYEIDNDGDLESLNEQAIRFINSIFS